MLDAYCQHLGANMGVGGTVEGERDRLSVARLALERRRHECADSVQQDRLQAERPHPHLPQRGVVRLHPRVARAPRPRAVLGQPPVLPELETGDYYPLHPHTRMLNRVKVHPQIIVENAADPYHIQSVHHGEPRGDHLVRAHWKPPPRHGRRQLRGRPEKTWLTPDGPVDATVIYDNYSLGLGIVRFPSELVATVQITGHTPVDEDYTDYYFTMACIREPGDAGDKPSGRAAKWIRSSSRRSSSRTSSLGRT